jgi:hypothetical protein
MFVPPFYKKLHQGSKNILMAGMGGGYDVFTAIPLYFELREYDSPPTSFLILLNPKYFNPCSSPLTL